MHYRIGSGLECGRGERCPGSGGPRKTGFVSTCDVGSESGTPVSDDNDASGNEFSGRVDWVQIYLGEDADHLISPQERLQIAMARQ